MKRTARLVRHAVTCIRTQWRKAILMAIATAAGVFFTTTVVALNDGAARQFALLLENWGRERKIAAYGRRLPAADGRLVERNSLTMGDYAALRQRFGDRALFFGYDIVDRVPVRFNGSTIEVRVQAVDRPYFDVREWYVESGEPLDLSDEESLARVCVLGRTVATKLFAGTDPVGKRITIRNSPFVVKGVLKPRGANVMGEDTDAIVFIPLATGAKRLFDVEGLRGIGFAARDRDDEEALTAAIYAFLRERHRITGTRPDDFKILNPAALREMYSRSLRARTLLGSILAAIAFLVGGSLITNIMMMAVAQRRAEIGLKRALGASRRDIEVEFFAEVLLITSAGLVAGILMALPVVHVVPRMQIMSGNWSLWPMAIGARTLFAASAFSLVLALVFGTYPARKAARVDPVEALR